MLKAVFFDLSGVLYVGKTAIAGAVAAITKIRTSNLQIRFVTNTSRRTRAQVLDDLHKLGFSLTADELFTAPVAVHDWLAQKNLRPYCLIHHQINSEFADIDQTNPNAVVIGDAEQGFNYDNLNRAFQLCHQGCPLIGIGYNRFFKLNGDLLLDAGPFIKAIEFATSSEALIIGKPAAEFFNQVLSSIQTAVPVLATEVLMVGDDIYGDIEGAINAGLQGCLVRTGKYQNGDENNIKQAHVVVDSIVEAVDYALAQHANS